METQNLSPLPLTPQPEPAPKKGKKFLIGILSLVAVGLLGYVGYSNPQIFQAAITEIGAPSGAGQLYIPDYNVGAGDEGTITLKSNLTSATSINSMQFTLTYEPTTALTFNENSIVMDSTTLFKSADLKSVNTSVPGQVVVSFFSGTAVSVPTGTQNLVKLAVKINPALAADTQIKLTAKEVDVIVPDGAGSFQSSPVLTSITAGMLTVSTQSELRVLRAETTSDTQVVVRFSDYLKSAGTNADYAIYNHKTPAQVINVTGIQLGSDQKSIVLTTDALTAGETYSVRVLNVNNVVGNTQGPTHGSYRAAVFAYETGKSAVVVNQVTVSSSTQIVLALSGAVNPSTVTPLNLAISSVDLSGANPVLSDLTVSNVTVSADGLTLTLTTAKQVSDRNYFVTFKGVNDMAGTPLNLGNQSPLNFFGFTVPKMVVANITPAAITNEVAKDIVVIGSNLNTIASARLGVTALTLGSQTAGALTLSVPAGIAPGAYELTLTNTVGETLTKPQAVVISAAQQPFKIISTESRATPNRVSPDGTTKIKFWVLVEDPVNLNAVSSVTINLEQIGGNRAQEMIKDTGTQPQNRQWYIYETTVDKRTPTKADPYTLPIEARQGDQVVAGTVSLSVTKDVYQSVAPTLDQVYFSPTSAPPDNSTLVTLSAKVTDVDGADTIKSVVADMGPLGAGFVTLKRLDVAGSANEQITGWFTSDTFKVPSTAVIGNYDVVVTATDETGESATKTVSFSVNSTVTGPKIDTKRSYLSPRKSVPRDGKTQFGVFVTVSDPDTLADVTSVIADFGMLGMSPAVLKQATDTDTSAKSGIYLIEGLTLPKTAPLGVTEIEVTATDKSGSIASVVLQIDVTQEDTLGEAPRILADRSYTTPRVAINDGQTPITLQVFVRDEDDDIKNVIVNLSNIGQVGPETPNEFAAATPASTSTEVAEDPCAGGSRVIACMRPSLKEGTEGQWFILSDITVSKNTVPSSEPYTVQVIATDETNHVDRQDISIFVYDGDKFTNDKNPPEIVAAVATSSSTVEVVFNEEIAANSISTSGAEFTITDRSDITDKLGILGATIDVTGTIATLTTEEQIPGRAYSLFGSTKITDAVGVPLVAGAKSRVPLAGFEPSDSPPVVEYIASSDVNKIEVEFRDNLRPSSLSLTPVFAELERLPASVRGAQDFNIEIFESGGASAPLKVKGVRFKDAPNVIEVLTETQKPNQKYRFTMKNVASASGITPRVSINKLFKGFEASRIQRAALGNAADLNGDGKVDFTDFTMFSAVYGTTYGAPAPTPSQPETSKDQGLSPIAPKPDATVPTTSPITQ